MGVSFSIPYDLQVPGEADESLLRKPCPACGGVSTLYDPEGSNAPDVDCEVCMGYGGDTPSEDLYWEQRAKADSKNGTFHVNWDGAKLILQDVLNVSAEEFEVGTMPVFEASMRLSLFTNPESHIREPSESQAVRISEHGVGLGCKIHDCGRSLEAVNRRLESLSHLLAIAQERGADHICWG